MPAARRASRSPGEPSPDRRTRERAATRAARSRRTARSARVAYRGCRGCVRAGRARVRSREHELLRIVDVLRDWRAARELGPSAAHGDLLVVLAEVKHELWWTTG